MTQVLQPLNEKAATIVMQHVDLLDGAMLEPQLLQLVAHVYACRVTLERWKQGEVSAGSVISYPESLADFIKKGFTKLKVRQAILLGQYKGRSQKAADTAAPRSKL
eukprot:gene7595-750_t